MNLGIEDAVIFSQLLAKDQLNEYTRIRRENATQVIHDSDVLVKSEHFLSPLLNLLAIIF